MDIGGTHGGFSFLALARTLDIMFEYKKKGKLSPLLKLKC